MDTIKINSIFALFKKKENMEIKEKANITLRVTETEENLILAIRNYCNSYPNGYLMEGEEKTPPPLGEAF